MENRTATYTTAPVDFDWFETETLGFVGTTAAGKGIRKVSSPTERVDAQRARYESGAIYLVADEDEWQNLVANGLVKLSGEPL